MTVKRIGTTLFTALLAFLVLAGCAVDRPPSGGPPDNAPLQITGTAPEPGSTGVVPESVRFTFNRYITAAALRNALSVTPVGTGHEISADGQHAVITFTEPLAENTTHSITLHSSLKSSRGNELENSYTYAFSTGPVLDTGRISGTVYTRNNRPASGITVAAVRENPRENGKLQVIDVKPEYNVQTGRNGSFEMNYIENGSYHLIVFRDRNGDRLINIHREEYAAGRAETIPTGTSDLLFRLRQPESTASDQPVTAPAVEPSGAVTGSISGARGTVVIEALNTASNQWHRTAVPVANPSRPEPYLLEGLPPGTYRMSAYIARNASAAPAIRPWDGGSIVPFRPADPLVIHPDDVRVRKGWTSGNIQFDFR
ncbi:Ig-like domain-containing protein [Prosthecochloris sp. N3]|uniref:Ig-like domain-containing protein n=1 Tax=Prosthecochloris ethylica TaxID=2743976 RepID=A0ABR9XPG9_9CHLB|nr:Ig-like domain-containing protein [Prosthecochloris ethylica]MBF0585828.1 Ig-like domain-containing protein [Prosthecochloris ethylica]MBF0635738.1 Ig-like domain-containing protein [Prosthecochloris ethylica]